MTTVLGVDGCKGGWLVVACPPFRFLAARAAILEEPAAIAAAFPHAEAVVIDMPIGLPATQESLRPTDRAARAFLTERNRDGHRGVGSRVFPPPSRAALEGFRAGLGYHALNRSIGGRKLSRQAFHITGKIAALDDWITPEAQARVREGHPEVAFAAHTGRTLPPKKTPAGAAARRASLAELGFDLARLAASLGPRTRLWATDDLHDACILAWTASRVAEARQIVLPDPPATDGHGLRMEIVA